MLPNTGALVLLAMRQHSPDGAGDDAPWRDLLPDAEPRALSTRAADLRRMAYAYLDVADGGGDHRTYYPSRPAGPAARAEALVDLDRDLDTQARELAALAGR